VCGNLQNCGICGNYCVDGWGGPCFGLLCANEGGSSSATCSP
jgi:hypothetical protein